ncbi:MAG: AgmX/PglI C-terminal domain-containing protein [Deltaproteobacteria bacterium]|nr:AgmX/PglI C-terminal domain-containing protein [Deltaproteobacteria bacterium]
MGASGTGGREKAASVIVRWRGRIIDEKSAEGTAGLTLGSGAGCDFVVPEELGAGEAFCLVEPAGERWVVNVPPGWVARVFTSSREEAGLARRAQQSIIIGETERVRIERGPVEVDVSCGEPKKAIRPALARALDRVFAGWLSVAGVFLLAVVWVAVSVVKEEPVTRESRIVRQTVRYINRIIKPVEPPKKVAVFDGKILEAKTPAVKVSKPSAQTVAGRRPMGKDETKAYVRGTGVLKFITGGGVPGNIFDPGLGAGVNMALSGVHGTVVGSMSGFEGLGGSRGGDAGPVPLVGMGGPGPVAPERRAMSDRVVLLKEKKVDTPPPHDEKVFVSGGLEKEVVGKVIRMHHQQAKYCYDRELTKNPNLFGKITVQFVIGSTGTVADARVSATEMNSEAVEDCLIRRVKTWFFPAPRGGGQVFVTYPFVFTSAGGR